MAHNETQGSALLVVLGSIRYSPPSGFSSQLPKATVTLSASESLTT